MHVLLVEDDRKIAAFVAKGLRKAGFTIDPVGNGEDGYTCLTTQAYDAVIVDIMLPGMDGLTLVKKVRLDTHRHTPIIFLSARCEVGDRVRGLQVGGDDYLVKPFAFPELIARLHALIRRAAEHPQEQPLTGSSSGAAPEGDSDNSVHNLAPRECQILRLLGTGQSYKAIASDLGISINTVYTHARRIRAKYGLEGNSQLLSLAVRTKISGFLSNKRV